MQTHAPTIASAGDAARLTDQLGDALHDLGADMGPAECHGLLCGLLVALPLDRRRAGLVDWVRGVLDPDALSGQPPASAERLSVLEAIGRSTIDMLESEELGFFPLLPADERPIGVRSRALGRWCGGFLSGLGASGRLDADTPLPDAVAEFIRDLSEIARIEPSPEADEASEAALAELIEYARVGVLLVQAELAAGGDSAGPRPATR